MLKEGSQNSASFVAIRDLDDSTVRGIRQGFFRLGAHLKATLEQQINQQKSGRTYTIRRGKRRFKHVSSAPGQTPARLRGNYFRGIKYQIRGADHMEFGIDESVAYASFLESGTARMKPRPGIRNAVIQSQRNAQSVFSSEINMEVD